VNLLDQAFSLDGRRIWFTGHRGMMGSALVCRLAHGHDEILTVHRQRPDLQWQSDVERWVTAVRPDAVTLAAAKVGGIVGNSRRPAEFLHGPFAMQTNVIESADRNSVQKLLFLRCSCIYPRLAEQPVAESSLLYLCRRGDNFDLETSHVSPALMRLVHEEKLSGERNLALWWTGTPRREFLYLGDCDRLTIGSL
jgi:GDP-L-fucose synthase